MDTTRAGKGCGSCKPLVAQIVDWAAGGQAEQDPAANWYVPGVPMDKPELMAAIRARQLKSVSALFDALAGGWQDAKSKMGLASLLRMMWGGEYAAPEPSIASRTPQTKQGSAASSPGSTPGSTTRPASNSGPRSPTSCSTTPQPSCSTTSQRPSPTRVRVRARARGHLPRLRRVPRVHDGRPVTCDKCANKTPEYRDDGQPIASGHRCAAHCTEISRYPAIPASCAEAHPREGESDGDSPAHGGQSHPDVRL